MLSRIINFSARQPAVPAAAYPAYEPNWFQQNPELTKGLATAAGAVLGGGIGGHQLYFGPLSTLPLTIATGFLPDSLRRPAGIALGAGLGYLAGQKLSAPDKPPQVVYVPVPAKKHGRRNFSASYPAYQGKREEAPSLLSRALPYGLAGAVAFKTLPQLSGAREKLSVPLGRILARVAGPDYKETATLNMPAAILKKKDSSGDLIKQVIYRRVPASQGAAATYPGGKVPEISLDDKNYAEKFRSAMSLGLKNQDGTVPAATLNAPQSTADFVFRDDKPLNLIPRVSGEYAQEIGEHANSVLDIPRPDIIFNAAGSDTDSIINGVAQLG